MAKSWLQQAIKEAHLKQNDLALEAGIIDKGYASRIFSLKVDIPPKLIAVLQKHGIKLKPTVDSGTNRGNQKSSLPSEKTLLAEFLRDRKISRNNKETGLTYYRDTLIKAPLTATTKKEVINYLEAFKTIGNKNTHLRALKTFYNWRKEEYKIDNPAKDIPVSEIGETIPPKLTKDQVKTLLASIDTMKNAQINDMIRARNKAMIILFVESGLRLSELLDLSLDKIEWQSRKIFVHGKGDKELFAPFEPIAQTYLKNYLVKLKEYIANKNKNKPEKEQKTIEDYLTNKSKIWLSNDLKPIGKSGVHGFLDTLEKTTGLPATNPHTFRRTFATLLLERGYSTKMIMMLGRWKKEDMVLRYTRGYTQDEAFEYMRKKNEKTGGLLDFLNDYSVGGLQED